MAATVAGVLLAGTHAARPAASAVSAGTLYSCSDHSLVYQSDASSWSTWANLAGTGSMATDALWDAKGDLAGGTGANTAQKLTAGANDTHLVADSAQTTGLKWAVPRLTFSLGPWYLNDIPGTATTQMLLMYMNTSTAVSQGGSSNSDFIMRTAGKVVGALLITDNSRTAGSATLQVRVAGSATAFDSGSVALDAGSTVRDSVFLTYANGLAFAANDALGVALVTSGYTPTTGDALAWLVVSLDVA
jgi:hypothetical protein